MALTGKKRLFAEAIVNAKPNKISNKQAALQIGCNENSASAAGSRWAADPEVQAFIAEQWADYYATPPALARGGRKQDTSNLPQQNALAFGVDWESVKAWLESLPDNSEELKKVANLTTRKLKLTTEPLDYWKAVLQDPYSTPKERQAAADGIAKYTIAKPAAANKKEAALEAALKMKKSTGDLFDNDEVPIQPVFKIPIFN